MEKPRIGPGLSILALQQEVVYVTITLRIVLRFLRWKRQ
jgi:hypothetical protein